MELKWTTRPFIKQKDFNQHNIIQLNLVAGPSQYQITTNFCVWGTI